MLWNGWIFRLVSVYSLQNMKNFWGQSDREWERAAKEAKWNRSTLDWNSECQASDNKLNAACCSVPKSLWQRKTKKIITPWQAPFITCLCMCVCVCVGVCVCVYVWMSVCMCVNAHVCVCLRTSTACMVLCACVWMCVRVCVLCVYVPETSPYTDV